jgi:hypothetical protein
VEGCSRNSKTPHKKEIKLYRRNGTHLLSRRCTLPQFPQWATPKTFDIDIN